METNDALNLLIKHNGYSEFKNFALIVNRNILL